MRTKVIFWAWLLVPMARTSTLPLARSAIPPASIPGNTGNGIAVYRFEQGKLAPDHFLKISLQPVPAGTHVARGLGKLPASRAIPYPAGLAVISGTADKKDQLLVANNLSDNVILLDSESGKELAHFDLSTHRFMPSSFPYTVVATRDGHRAWCSLWNASQVAELDLVRKTVVRRIPLLVPKSSCRSRFASHRDASFSG